MEDRESLGCTSKSYIEGPHPLILLTYDARRLYNQGCIHLKSLDQRHRYDRDPLIKASSGRLAKFDAGIHKGLLYLDYL